MVKDKTTTNITPNCRLLHWSMERGPWSSVAAGSSLSSFSQLMCVIGAAQDSKMSVHVRGS
jgi:hypothetical protein